MSIDRELLERFYDRQEEIVNSLADIKVILAKQEENLKLHIYRTELAERNLEILKEELKPIKAHVTITNAILKTLGAASILVGMGAGIVQIIKFFSH